MLYETEHAYILVLYILGVGKVHIHTGTGIFCSNEIQIVVACGFILKILFVTSDAGNHIVAELQGITYNLGVSAW